MSKSMRMLLILALAVILLLSTDLFTGVSSQTSSSEPVSAPATEWQREYGENEYVDIFDIGESTTNLIQTSDGGYAFLSHAWGHQVTFRPSTLYKVDSLGKVQWNKTIPFLSALALIQTNDEGYEISGYWSTYGIGVAYEHTPTLVKTDVQGNIQWVANYSSVPDLGVASNSIQTSDGGFAYLQSGKTSLWGRFTIPSGSIVKTDSNNNTQWVKNLTYPSIYGNLPFVLSSLIETSDGALAGLGVGSRALGDYDGRIYLIKTEAFLPLPSQAPLPTPLPTPLPALTVEAAVIVSLIIGVFVVAGLLVFLKKRKH